MQNLNGHQRRKILSVPGGYSDGCQRCVIQVIECISKVSKRRQWDNKESYRRVQSGYKILL